MTEPTQEQRKKFFEWCGLVHIDNPKQEAANSCEAISIDKPISGWYKPDYSKATSELVSLRETPKVDLNNLFKYAVPKLQNCILSTSLNGGYLCNLYFDGKWSGSSRNNDPALALFWAIYEVIK